MRQHRVGLAFLGEDFGIERRLGREVLEQQRFRNGGRRRHTLGRGAGKAVAGKASLGCAKDQLPAQVAGHAKAGHLVSKHSPTPEVNNFVATHQKWTGISHTSSRHGQATPGHPRPSRRPEIKTWMPGTSPGMTTFSWAR